MLPTLGPTELIIILIIILLLFGVGRVSKIAGEFGKGLREFRQGLSEGDKEKEAENTPKKGKEEKES
jgi:sec-independent protein translocase protein TatA